MIPLSQQLLELAPWKWMYESELFGVEPPGSDFTYFASIMGSAGQFTALSFYEGGNAADQFLFIQETEIGSNPKDILLIPHLMVTFAEPEDMQPEDRSRIKNLGYSPDSNKQWPVFLQYLPGHPPVFPDLKRLRHLLPLLEQTIFVVKDARKKGLNFITRTNDGIQGMLRSMNPETNSWHSENRAIPTRYISADIRFSEELAARLKQIPLQDIVLETDLVLFPMPIADKDPEYFPFAFLLIDQQSGYIVHCEMISPHPSVDEMFASCGQLLLKILTGQNIRPIQIHVRSWRLHLVLKKVLSGTPVHLSLVPELPAVDEAGESMLNFFQFK